MNLSGLSAYRPSAALLRQQSQYATKQAIARLTPEDKELVRQVTGQQLGPTSTSLPSLAAQIAADRQSGVLKPGQKADATYLKGIVVRGLNPHGTPASAALLKEVQVALHLKN